MEAAKVITPKVEGAGDGTLMVVEMGKDGKSYLEEYAENLSKKFRVYVFVAGKSFEIVADSKEKALNELYDELAEWLEGIAENEDPSEAGRVFYATGLYKELYNLDEDFAIRLASYVDGYILKNGYYTFKWEADDWEKAKVEAGNIDPFFTLELGCDNIRLERGIRKGQTNCVRDYFTMSELEAVIPVAMRRSRKEQWKAGLRLEDGTIITTEELSLLGDIAEKWGKIDKKLELNSLFKAPIRKAVKILDSLFEKGLIAEDKKRVWLTRRGRLVIAASCYHFNMVPQIRRWSNE